MRSSIAAPIATSCSTSSPARIRRPRAVCGFRAPTIAAASCSRCGAIRTASSLASLGSDQRVGVPVGSLVSMTLAKGGAATSPFVFEDDIVAALANREIEAAAVTPMTVGWFNLQHADKPLRLIPAFDNDQDLNWNIAAGLLRPDDKLRAARRCGDRGPAGGWHHRADLCPLRHRAAASAVRSGGAGNISGKLSDTRHRTINSLLGCAPLVGLLPYCPRASVTERVEAPAYLCGSYHEPLKTIF